MATYVMPQTSDEFQAILDAALLVATEGGAITQTLTELQAIINQAVLVDGDGGQLTQTLAELQTFIDSGGSGGTGVSVNLLAASQPIVQSVTGSTLPDDTTPQNYTAGDEIAFGYYAATDITNCIVDGFGNLTLSDTGVDTGSVYFECDIPTNIAIADLHGYAIEGAVTNVTTSFTSTAGATGLTLSEVSGKARGVIDLAQAKAFAFSISEQVGSVNVDNDGDINEKVLGGVGAQGNYVDIIDYGFTISGTWSFPIINGYQTTELDYSKITLIGGESAIEIENSAEMTAEVIAAGWGTLTSFTSAGNWARLTRVNSTSLTVTVAGGRGVIQLIGYLKPGVI